MFHGPVKDALVGAPGAVLAGAARDFAETHQNPSFVAAKVAPLGWYFGLGELAVGAVGIAAAAMTGDDVLYEATEGVLFAGVADSSANVVHFVRNRTNTNSLKRTPVPASAQPAATAPTALVGRVARQALVAPLSGRPGAGARPYVYPTANEVVA